jgi:beta-lactamase regulating signal transducer with metallopeptidase domain
MTETLLAFIANAAWQAAVIGLIGLLLAPALRPAQRRFQFLAITLAVAACAPLLTLLPRQARPAATAIVAPRIQPIGAQIAAGAYVAAVALAAVRLARAVTKARKIARSSFATVDGARVSPLIDAPITIGRTIIVPPSIIDDARLLAAALAHERAHVRRNDYAWHVALECLALPLSFHPVVILLRRAIAEAREIACDEEAAAQCGAGEYAQALVRIASLAATRRTAMSVGMAATPIERRVIALLRRNRQGTRRPMALVLALPFVAAAACSRVDVAPAVEQMTLGGRWALVRETSDLHLVTPRGYDAFTQTIEQGPTRVAVRQRRVLGGRAFDVNWSVVTDGVTRPLGGNPRVRSTATWKNGRLMLQMAGPGTHRENATAFIRGGRLICDGDVTNRGRFHAEFRRIDP